MDPVKWQKIKLVFNEAVELSPDQQAVFFRDRKDIDAEILIEAEKLLAAEKENNFEIPIANVADIWQETDAEDFIDRKIGDYKIIREIGRGGMGIVFEAIRRGEDFSQTVALKLLKRGVDFETMIRRFRHERQILASLDHPNIARFLDSGMTDEKIPFFAMEFVDGKQLNDFCNENNLDIRQKLELFLQVCAAVSFAHSRLVVHRDLKPSNIVVTEKGTVKLLDFGIAKILLPETDLTAQTVTALGMMTPAFASPEQIKGEMISTASDIYSLGLILYELLTGVSAYQFPNKRPDEIARIICEIEPPRPSAAVNNTNDRLIVKETQNREPSTSESQPPTDRKLKTQNSKFLKGDLDNIILKALRKEPARRYVSVEQFAGDISRHLAGLPVIARSDTFSYRFEKFIKRNRLYVMTSLLILLILLGGIAATTWQAYRAEKQRKLTEERFRQVRELANNIVFKYYDEAEKLPNSTALREMFVKDSLDYFDSLANDTAADENLKIELGKTFLRIAKVQGRPLSPNLGNTTGAIENYLKGIEILEPLVGNLSNAELQSDLVSAYADIALVLKQSGNSNDADNFLRKSISAGEEFLQQNPDNISLASRVALSYVFLGDSLPIGIGENENVSVYKKALAAYKTLLEDNPDDLRLNNFAVATRERLGYALMTLAESAEFDENQSLKRQYLQEAESLLKENVEISEKMLQIYPKQILTPALLASAEVVYGRLLIETEDYFKAEEFTKKGEKFYRENLETDPVSVGPKVELATVERSLGTIYLRTGNPAKAETHFKHAFELLDYLIEKDAENFDYLKFRGESKFDFADEFLRRGEIEKARQIYETAFNEMLALSNKKNPAFSLALNGLFYEKRGNIFLAKGEKDKAIAEYQKAVEIWKKTGVLNFNGNAQPDKLNVLERKINRLKNR